MRLSAKTCLWLSLHTSATCHLVTRPTCNHQSPMMGTGDKDKRGDDHFYTLVLSLRELQRYPVRLFSRVYNTHAHANTIAILQILPSLNLQISCKALRLAEVGKQGTHSTREPAYLQGARTGQACLAATCPISCTHLGNYVHSLVVYKLCTPSILAVQYTVQQKPSTNPHIYILYTSYHA